MKKEHVAILVSHFRENHLNLSLTSERKSCRKRKKEERNFIQDHCCDYLGKRENESF